jgi:hypothetical protein
MKKIDARSLSRAAHDEMRLRAGRLRRELKLTWAEIAEVVGEKWLRMFRQSFLRTNKVTALRFQAARAAPVLLK